MTLARFQYLLLLCGAAVATATSAAAPANATLIVSNAATKNVACSAGVCEATAKNAVLNASDLAAMLAASNIKVRSTVKAKDIELRVALSWASASRLTLDAYQSITFDKPLTVAGPGALTLTVNDGGTGGELSFETPGRAIFWDLSSNLVIDGAGYTLAGDVATLASDIAADPSGHYALGNNYDASVDGTYASSPIATTFTGTLQGLGNAISNLTIDDTIENDNVGFISTLGAGGAVSSIGLKKVSVIGAQASYIGGLVGYSEGLVGGSTVQGSVSMAMGSPEGGGTVGGLVGVALGGSIVDSTANVNVLGRNAADDAGGLVGGAGAVSIAGSQAHGAVSAANHAVVGGLIGSFGDSNHLGIVSGSFSTGSATVEHGNSVVGGFIGANGGTILNCYSTGNASAGKSSFVGGFVGNNFSSIGSSYSTGSPSAPRGGRLGGFLGNNFTTVSDDYWDTTTSGTDVGVGGGDGSGVAGLTTQQLQSGLPVGFDPAVWGEDPAINGGLPYLLSNSPE
ncbi:MAG TPA: hypothetical protein VIM02_03395 [Rhizomicrobium sp.]